MEETITEAIVEKHSKKPLVIVGILLGLVLAVYLGFCVVAANTQTIYPGRAMRGIDLGGLTVAQAAEKLEAEFPKQLFTLRFSTGAPESEPELLQLSYGELGARLEYDLAAQMAHKELSPGNFFTNGWEYFACLTGLPNQLDWCDLTLDEDDFATGKALLLSSSYREALDASYQLAEHTIVMTIPRDGQAIAAAQGAVPFETALRQALTTAESMEIALEILPAKTLTAQALHDELAGEMKNAGYDPETKSITPERIGAEFDVPAAQALLDGAKPGETVEIPAEISFPAVTAEALRQVLFQDVLGTYTTHVGGSAGRIGNVKLSAGKVDGFIMNAGEIFSYNDVVGERTAANGYQPAPAYVKGETVDEIGGGICQTSSTLYYAALLSNLEIVERYAHRYAPAYITWGMDATVSWGGPEFRFRNDTDYPVKLVTSVSKKNYLTITVYGTKTEEFTVKMTNKVLSDTPFEELRQEDPTLPAGTEKVKITPYTGHKVEAYRNVYGPDGKLISSKWESTSDYKVRNKVILVGPQPAAAPELPPVEVPPETELPPEAALPAGGEAAIPPAIKPTVPAEPIPPQEPPAPPLA